MLLRAVKGHRLKSWLSRATRSKTSNRLASVTSVPPHRTVPCCGRYKPEMILASVVFPLPFSPTSATTSPGRTVRSTPPTAACRWPL